MGNIALIKKILNGGLVIGGLLSIIGGIIALVNVNSDTLEEPDAMFGTATMGRVGAIICFVLSLIIVGLAFLLKESNKIPSFATAGFGVLGFVAQFIFNPITSMSAFLGAAMSNFGSFLSGTNSDDVVNGIRAQSTVGLILLLISALALAIIGVMSFVKKPALPFTPYNGQYAQPVNNNPYGQPVNNNQYTQPVNNNQYAQPVNNNPYGQPVNNNQYTQPTSTNPYGAPANNQYGQQPVDNNPYNNNNFNG